MSAKVVIVDDHSMVREGLKQLLELDGDVEVIGEACDGVECLVLLEKVLPQVLLLDINMPNMNGLEVLERLKQNNVDVKVIILTVHNEIEFLLKAVEIGIDGYLLKLVRDYSVKTIFGSDSHTHDTVGYKMKEYNRLMEELQF